MAYESKEFKSEDALLASDMNNIIAGIDECKETIGDIEIALAAILGV